MKPDTRLGFLGAGAVARSLAAALAAAGYPVVAVHSRTEAAAHRLAALVAGCAVEATAQGVVDAADLVFISTPDDAVAAVAASVAWRRGAAVHCSGALGLDALAPARAAGLAVGSFHPLQTFPRRREVTPLAGITFGVEADDDLWPRLAALATAVGGRPVRLRAEDKALYHAAGVFASNYIVALTKVATDLWGECGVDRPTATAALVPLLRGAVEAIEAYGLADALTGPVARGDAGTVRRHLAALAARAPAAAPIYRALAEQLVPLARERGGKDVFEELMKEPAGTK